LHSPWHRTADNEVSKVEHAGNMSADQGRGKPIFQDPANLHGALAMAGAPGGDFLVTNSDVVNPDPAQPSEIVEFTTGGTFVNQLPVGPSQGGSFGPAMASSRDEALAFVDDDSVPLAVWTLPVC
jgi:hypothetical protein